MQSSAELLVQFRRWQYHGCRDGLRAKSLNSIGCGGVRQLAQAGQGVKVRRGKIAPVGRDVASRGITQQRNPLITDEIARTDLMQEWICIDERRVGHESVSARTL